MNNAQKIIVSFGVPILVGIPILSIELKKNYVESEGLSSWNPAPLYEYPMAWWGVALVSFVFLIIFWGNKKDKSSDDNS
jgi:hypothetical protein